MKKKKNFKADLFFHALRQNLVKIEKPKFNEKVGFMGFLLAKKIFWINAYHTALMQFNSLQYGGNNVFFFFFFLKCLESYYCIFLLPLQMFDLTTITKSLGCICRAYSRTLLGSIILPNLVPWVLEKILSLEVVENDVCWGGANK